MVTVVGIDKYAMTLEQRGKLIKKAEKNSEKESSKFMMATARRLAPSRTGETIRGIRRRKVKDGYNVTSRVRPKGRTGFRQNLWTNRSVPHDRPSMWWNGGRPTLYGDGSHRTTGNPGWWNIAVVKTRRKFLKATLANTRNALRMKL